MLLPFLIGLITLFLTTKNLFAKARSREEQITDLEVKGLIETVNYKVNRAFGIEEWGDEGSHYFLELEDKSILYLRDQKLCEYEPIEDDPELNQPRQFPCTEFTIRKHKTKGYLIDLFCAGEVLEPEIIIPITHRAFFIYLLDLEPYLIIRNRTYDQIKTEHLQRSQEKNI